MYTLRGYWSTEISWASTLGEAELARVCFDGPWSEDAAPSLGDVDEWDLLRGISLPGGRSTATPRLRQHQWVRVDKFTS